MKHLSYSRERAVNYAINFAAIPNPNFKYFIPYGDNGGDCTNFTSQCLNAGGAPMIFSGNNQWWYYNKNSKNNSLDKWSVSWAVANSLYWYLKNNYVKNLYGIKGKEVSDIKTLEIGDMIFFKDSQGNISHSAIITSFDDYGIPLIAQHTPNVLNIPYMKKWAVETFFIKIIL